MQNLEQTIMSQFANSPTLMQLIKNLNECIDPSANIDKFYSDIWNIETATTYGLNVWGRIVNISRQLYIPDNTPYFGFKDGINDYAPFGQGVFYTGKQEYDVYTLSDSQYRTLILTKALSNISNCTAQSINKVLQFLFAARGRAYVIDLGGMKMRLVFEFGLEPFELSIVQNSGAIPRPAGVGVEILQIPPGTFGFVEAGALSNPWDVGTFKI